MNLNKILIMLFILIFSNISLTTATVVENKIYPLENNSYISLSDVLSFQNNLVSEYDKNFRRYPPENKQLSAIFVLNSSFDSTILLSYYGSIGFYFQKSTIPTIKITYLNESQYGTFLGLPFTNYVHISDNTYYNIGGQGNYAYATNVYDLTSNFSKKFATDYYILDYAYYLKENAHLKQIEEKNLQKLNKSAEELIKIYQSNDEIEKANATIRYYQLADDLGIADDSANKILEDLKNKSQSLNEQKGFTYTPFWYTGITAIYFMIMGFVFVRIERYKNKLKIQGKIGSVAYITHIFEGILALGGLAYFVHRAPSELGFSQYVVIAVSIIIGIALTLKYEKPSEVEQEQEEESNQH
ncbi:MAG: hypothetical protein WAW23_07950 [Candidatus Methanoperedens sp.]